MSLLLLGVSRPEFVGVIDAVGIDAQVAYSTRKLRAAYTGSAIRVRRSSDNTELDIGFSNNELDTAALLAHCGAGNGFIVTWYDQSGNSRDVTQATAGNQPQIVSSGSVLTLGSKPTAQFDGGDWVNANLSFTSLTVNAIFKANVLTSVHNLLRHQPGTGTEWALRLNPGYRYYRVPTIPSPVGTPGTVNAHVFTGLQSDGGSLRAFADGELLYSATAPGTANTSGWFAMGALSIAGVGSEFLNGCMSEALTFGSNLTTIQRHILESNQGAYYSIASLGIVQWANTYQAPSPSTVTGNINDLAAGDQTTYEQVTGSIGELVGITAVQNITVARGFTALSARLYFTDTLEYVIDRWDGAAWVADIVTIESPPLVTGGGEWGTLTASLDPAKTTTKVRISVRTQGAAIPSDVRIGDFRIS